MVFQISISILCLFTLVAVIAVILSFDTPPFAIYAPVSFVCCGLWIFCHCCHASHFCNCFHELLDFTFTNWLLGVPQCRLRFCQTFRPLHVLYINSPWLPYKFKIFEVHLEVFLNSPRSKMLAQGVPQWVVQAFGIVTTQCTALP